MTYFELINTIRNICLSHQNVRTFYYGNAYEFDLENEKQDVKYSSICLTPNQHNVSSNYNTFDFELRYIDRQTENRLNKVEIHSTAISTLKDIINTLLLNEYINLYGNDSIYSLPVTTFRDSYSNICAGAYINLQIIINSDECVYE